MASSTLATIRQAVRRITRSPSTAQLSDADLDQYINTFIEQDIPTTMKLFSLRTVLTFYTQPGVDVYETNTTDPLNPLYDFKNRYTAVHSPVFIAGVRAFYTQDRGVFYGNWPQTNAVQQTGLFGNGGVGPFVGVLPPPLNTPTQFGITKPHILHKSVLISALDAAGTAMTLVDTPTSNILGNMTEPNDPTILGTINYQTGDFTVIFPSATAISVPPQGNPIWSEAIYYVPGLPTTMLFYDQKFTLRPVPDKSYVVQIEANIRPTELLQTTDVPQIKQWWQWIALGASLIVFRDRSDPESRDAIMPDFMNQQSLALSTSMEQYTNQRSITIYTNNGLRNSWNNFGQWPY